MDGDSTEGIPTPDSDLRVTPLLFWGTDAILVLSGELRRDTSSQLEQAALESARALHEARPQLPDRFIFDLSAVAYIDAGGLQALAACTRIVHIREKARDPDFVVFRGAQGQALRMLTATYFDVLYPFLP